MVYMRLGVAHPQNEAVHENGYRLTGFSARCAVAGINSSIGLPVRIPGSRRRDARKILIIHERFQPLR